MLKGKREGKAHQRGQSVATVRKLAAIFEAAGRRRASKGPLRSRGCPELICFRPARGWRTERSIDRCLNLGLPRNRLVSIRKILRGALIGRTVIESWWKTDSPPERLVISCSVATESSVRRVEVSSFSIAVTLKDWPTAIKSRRR